MKLLIIYLSLISSTWAENTPPPPPDFLEVVSGIPYVPGINCLKTHNIRRACLSLDQPRMLPESSNTSTCFKGNDSHHSESTVIKCGHVMTSPNSPIESTCDRIKKTHYTQVDICSIPSSDYNPTYIGCFADDIQAYRNTNCPVGCENVPKSHICDWTPQQFAQYQNCSSVKYLGQRVRQVLCPQGLADVGVDGPPPRIRFRGFRNPRRENYLSFKKVFIAINSVMQGEFVAQYCLYPTGGICQFQPVTNLTLSPDGKSYLKEMDVHSQVTNYTLKVRKKYAPSFIYKTAKVDFTMVPLGSPPTPNSIDMVWAELIGPELSPVLRRTDFTSDQFIQNDTTLGTSEYPVFSEVKDVTGRRWKRYPADHPYLDPSGPSETDEIDCREVIIDLCTYDTSNNTYLRRYKTCGCGSFIPNPSETDNPTNMGCTTIGDTAVPSSHCFSLSHSEDISPIQYMNTSVPADYTLPPDSGAAIKIHFNNEVFYNSFVTNFHNPRYLASQPSGIPDPAENTGHNIIQYADTPPEPALCPFTNINYVCNKHNKWVAIIRCTGGAQPPVDITTGEAYNWIPYVYPGQFIYRPESDNDCNAQGINTSTVYSNEALPANNNAVK